jgi:ribonuclease E
VDAPVTPGHKSAPVVAQAAGGGFFGWLKSLIGMSDAPEAPAAADKKATAPARADGRPGERREGGRDGRREGGRGPRSGSGRTGQGERREGGPREGREDTREPRGEGRADNRGLAADGTRPERRGAERQRRGNRPESDSRNGTTGGGESTSQALNAQGQDRNARPAQDGDMSANPADGRGNRNPRGERRERGERSDRPDRTDHADRSDRAGGAAERRNARSSRSDESQTEDNAAVAPLTDAAMLADGGVLAGEQAASEARSNMNGARDDRAERGERSERRSRDRYGRDRRPRADRSELTEAQSLEQAPEQGGGAPLNLTSAGETQPNAAQVAATEGLTGAAPDAGAPLVALAAPLVTASTNASPKVLVQQTHSLPKVQSFVLPTEALDQIASGSGLQWVQSDAAKVSEAQARIADELAHAPAHIPRERSAAVVISTEPLVLVETRKSLSDVQVQLFGTDTTGTQPNANA